MLVSTYSKKTPHKSFCPEILLSETVNSYGTNASVVWVPDQLAVHYSESCLAVGSSGAQPVPVGKRHSLTPIRALYGPITTTPGPSVKYDSQ